MNQDLNPIQIPIKPYGLDLTVQAVEQPNSTDVQRLLRNDKAKMSCLVTFPVLELAYNPIRRYSFLALGKISRSTLAGCNNKGVHSPHRAFFVRYLSMPMHILYASCGGRTSSDVLVTFITSLLTDPHGLRQSFSSEVQAFNQNKGAHSHA